MANNRLYIYDPESKKAVCIAKGWAFGWKSIQVADHIREWLNEVEEWSGCNHSTRLQLITETDLPEDVEITDAPYVPESET